MLASINFAALISFLVSGYLFWQRAPRSSKSVGSTWRLRDKMLLMPMTLGAGMVSAHLIVPRGVLVFPVLGRGLHEAGQRCCPLLPLWVLRPTWCFLIYSGLAGGKTPQRPLAFPAWTGGPQCVRKRRGAAGAQGGAFLLPQKLSDGRAAEQPPSSCRLF